MSLDPILAKLLEAMPLEVELPIDWPALRVKAAAMTPLIRGEGPRTEVASVEERHIDGPTGPVPIRIYRPKKAATTTLHYVNGGGWTIGDLETVDHTIRYLCEALPAVMVSSTYRLAPEHPFPAAYDDTLAAARWVVEHATDLGGDPSRLVLAGDSAGGNLAAAAALALRASTDPTDHPIKAQLLLYPAVDLRASSWSAPSRVADADPNLPCAAMRATADAYAGEADRGDWRLSPIAAADLAGLPPTLIAVLTVDPLRDEAVAYAERLRQAGVAVETLELPHLTHGFVHLRRIVPAAADASDKVVGRLRSLLGAG